MNNINVSYSRTMNVMRGFMMLATRLAWPATLAKPQAWRLAWLAGLLWSGALVSRADTHYVSLDGTNDAGGGYTTWVGAATQIQWAVDAASAATFDTVLVSNGTYNLTNQVSITKNITLRSLNGTNFTFINGNYNAYTNRCVYMSAGILDGFTISNGYDAGTASYSGGGGVYLYEGSSTSPAVYNCHIYKNYCYNTNTYSGGGGIYIKCAFPFGGTISNCTIVSNTVYTNSLTGGGGIYTWWGGLVVNSYISGNSAYSGGGIRTFNATVITNCTVANNLAGGGVGGGIYLWDYNLTRGVANCVISNNVAFPGDAGGLFILSAMVKNSIIIGNVARDGGGGEMQYGSVLSNCQVIANTASNWPGGGLGGGGIYLWGNGGAEVITDCIIASNVAVAKGGGLSVNAWGLYPQLVKNCLIYGNTSLNDNGGGIFTYAAAPFTNSFINCTIVDNESRGVWVQAAANTRFDNCIILSNKINEVYPDTGATLTSFWYTCSSVALADGQGNITNNPLFVDQGNRNYRLSTGSPCVNTGTNMSWMTNAVDLDGRIRIRYGTVDMGAYEFIHSGTIFRVW
ncbi:MAG: right-handed parallel beta-helix repeat-containing protein [Kiritimatiellae bacterium]|nr:right-handed parallel beta-helix repeat-containing protein [Kiritimatiellia bacterium]